MKKIYNLLVLCALVSGEFVFGQQTPILQQNYFNNYSLQPAYVGYYKGIDAWSGYRRSMFGFTGNPTSALMNVSYRTSETQSFGVNLQSDQSGLLRNNLFHVSYAYRVKFNNASFLSIGTSLGIAENRFDFTGVRVEDNTDFGVIANNGKTMFNASLGFAYLSKNWEVGLGFLNFTSNKASYESGRTILTYQLRPSYVANAAYKYEINNDFFVKPGVIMRNQKSQEMIFDLFTTVGYKKAVEVTLGYRSTNVLPIIAMFNIYKGVHAYYGYEVSLGNFAQASKGGHEFGVGYRVSLNKSIDNYVSHEKELLEKNDSLKLVVKRLGDTIQVKQNIITTTKKENETLNNENTQLENQNEFYAKEIDSLLNVIKSQNKNLIAPKVDGNKVEVETANGYYVVVESSKNRTALEKDLVKWEKELDQVIIIKGAKHNWYYISMFRGNTKREALKVMKEARKKYPKAWVKIQKLN
jgi:type IX secretion system PorP/SprF family membrane protein